jgi:hypothetical protein
MGCEGVFAIAIVLFIVHWSGGLGSQSVDHHGHYANNFNVAKIVIHFN